MNSVNFYDFNRGKKFPTTQKKGNYWCLSDRNKKLFLRFPYINSNRVIDVYPNDYSTDVINLKGSPLKHVKYLNMYTGIGLQRQLWDPALHLSSFFIFVPLQLPHSEFKLYKRVNILQYIYFLYTQPEQFNAFNTEMLLKQYIRTSDFVTRTTLAQQLFDILRSNFPVLSIVPNIFEQINYDKVLDSRMIAVPPIVNINQQKSVNEDIISINSKDEIPEINLINEESKKGNINVANHVEAVIRIYP